MSEVEREAEAKKPESKKTSVWIQSADGSIQEVEQKIAMICPTICREMQSGLGYSKSNPITMPSKVKPAILSLVLDYCRFHDVPGRSYKECKSFDEKFLAVDTITLCELIVVANYLQLGPLVSCACAAMGQDILNTSPEVVFHMLNRGYDDTKENQSLDSSTCNSGNKLSHSRSTKVKKEVEEKKDNAEDSRSIDDLVSFINGEDSKEDQSSKKKKKKQKKRQAQNNSPSICASSSNTADISKKVVEGHFKDSCSPDAGKLGFKSTCSLSSTLINKLKQIHTQDEASTLEEGFDDSGFDRVVQDFQRKINLNTNARMWEMYFESERTRP